MHLRGVYSVLFCTLYILLQCSYVQFVLSEENYYVSQGNSGKKGGPYESNKIGNGVLNFIDIKNKIRNGKAFGRRVSLNKKTPIVMNTLTTNEVANKTDIDKCKNATKPSNCYFYFNGEYRELDSNKIDFAPYYKTLHRIKTKYSWEDEDEHTTQIDYKNLNLDYLISKALSQPYSKRIHRTDSGKYFEEFVKYINETTKTLIDPDLYKNDQNNYASLTKITPEVIDYKRKQHIDGELTKEIILSNSDPISLIQENETLFQNMRWPPHLKDNLPIELPEKMLNFEYNNEVEEDELNGNKGDIFKQFLNIASDFSFLSGSTLNAAVCMYKAVMPLMMIRWKYKNSLTISRLDSIIKMVMGIPFFKYFEEKENMINVCVDMFHITDINAYEGLGLGDKSFDSSIIGISVSDFKVYQYFKNKKYYKDNGNTKIPKDPANLLEMVYDDICHYFYECMDEDLNENIEDYLFKHSHIFDATENNIEFESENVRIPFLPDISERRTSIDSLPSDKFIASLHEISYFNFDLPEMSFPGLNIRDISRLYYYSGRIGLKLPIRLMLKMIYEISNFANYSSLLRQGYCTESLSKITNFKLSEVLCSIAFMYIPSKIHDSNTFITVKDIERRVLAAPSKRKFRYNPVCSNAELNSLKNPDILYVPDFFQFGVSQDKWMLYRSLSIQLYGSIAVQNGESISSIISLIHSVVIGYIKLNWDEFRILYNKVGASNPELYYSLLINNSRGPALIELIAFSRIYQIPIKIYSKYVKRDSELKIEFHLEKELTDLVENLSKVEYDNNNDKHFEGNVNKLVPCKIIRLLVDKKAPYRNNEFYENKNDLIPEEAKITANIQDKSNWIWDSLLPLYDKKTNYQIISKGMGIKVNYLTIVGNSIDKIEKTQLEDKYGLNNNETIPSIEDAKESKIRRHSNYTYGKILIHNLEVSKREVNQSDKEKKSDVKHIPTGDDTKHLNQYFVVVQPLISFLEAGVYESRMFMYKIFEDLPLFNWDKLHETIDLNFLQNIVYIGDMTNLTSKIENKESLTQNFQDNDESYSKGRVNFAKYSKNYLGSDEFSELPNENEYKTEFVKLKPGNLYSHPKFPLSEYKSGFDKIKSENESSLPELNLQRNNIEFPPIFLPTKKPWSNKIKLSEYNLASEEAPFSFIPFTGSLPKPRPINGVPHKIDFDFEILFEMTKDYWMLPFDMILKVLFCFSKSISPYLFNPDPDYTPNMIIYDKIISTVISQLPVIDKNLKTRPIAFIITVCEMALLDPIDLNQFLFFVSEDTDMKNSETPKSLIKMIGKIHLVKKTCSKFSNCVYSDIHNHKISRFFDQQSTSMIYNPLTPGKTHVIQIQKLIPRFPEVVIISKNIFRMVYFVGRKGISIEGEALYQIAKELSILVHSISPFIWKSSINLDKYEGFNFIKRNDTFDNKFSYIPTYDEAYWNNFDRQLLLNTCASVLTTRGVLSYPNAMVICHYTFLRVPLSRFGISSSIPSEEDLKVDERVSMQSVSFYLGKIFENPVEIVKSADYYKNPMKLFIDTFSKLENEHLIDWSNEVNDQFRSFLNSEYVSEIYMKYEDFIKYISSEGESLAIEETMFERMHPNDYNSDEFNYSKGWHQNQFYDSNSLQEKFLGKLDRHYIDGRKQFSNFWRYIPDTYKKNLKKSIFKSPIDDIFESVSLLLYGTNTYKPLIMSTILSAISLIEKSCESEDDIVSKLTLEDLSISVEGVEEDVVSFVFEKCEKRKIEQSMQQKEFEYLNEGDKTHHLYIFELIQFIYKIPLMVFDIDNNSKFVSDTEINHKLYDLMENNVLLYSIKILRTKLNGKGKLFKYQPLIPKVDIEDFFNMKNGIGPIPRKVMARTISLTKRKNAKYGSNKFRRTLFSDAVENYYNRKKPQDFFKNMKEDGRSYEDLVPLFRKYIPFSPGEIEGNRILQFSKMTSAIIDLKRRPIKELPDFNMEKSIKSLLLNDKLEEHKSNLINNYGIDFDELTTRHGKPGLGIISEEEYRELMSRADSDRFHRKKFDLYTNTRKLDNSQVYKFILDYYKYVKNSRADPDLLESILEVGKYYRPFEQEKRSENEEINEIIKHSTMRIFSELYYYWNKLMLKLNNFYYDAKYQMGFGYTEEEKKDLVREKNLKNYIKSGVPSIIRNEANQRQGDMDVTQKN